MKQAKKKGPTTQAKRIRVAGIAPGAAGLRGKGPTGASDPGALSKSHLSGVRRLQRGVADLPEFCDFDCPHATFSPPDASGACRRDQAVWCVLVGRYNNKNARCLGRPKKQL